MPPVREQHRDSSSGGGLRMRVPLLRVAPWRHGEELVGRGAEEGVGFGRVVRVPPEVPREPVGRRVTVPRNQLGRRVTVARNQLGVV